MSYEHTMHTVGAQLWPETYGAKANNDQHAMRVTAARCIAMGATKEFSVNGEDVLSAREDAHMMLCAAARWVDGGCRLMQSDSKYFSAMAQTKLSDDAAVDLHIPWPAFCVRLPKGLIVAADGMEYTFAYFAQFTNLNDDILGRVPVASSYAICSDGGPALWQYEPFGLADLLFRPHIDHSKDQYHVELSGTEEQSVSDIRIRRLVAAAVVGMLYTMQHTNNWRFGGHFDRAGTGKRIRSEPPPHRVILIGKPISVDVSDAVRSDARSGLHSAPSVQTLVRGHIKRQVIGVGRIGRKVIWVEPYWRGPEDAPILARPYKVGPSDKAATA